MNTTDKNINLFEECVSLIASCYSKKDFPKSQFFFYENRRDYKDTYRTGILKEGGNPKFFFKILENDFYSQETEILRRLVPFFKIIPILFVKQYGNIFIHLYKYVDAHSMDGYSFLRKKTISYLSKKKALQAFMTSLKEQINSTLCLRESINLNPSNKLFFERLNPSGRSFSYYGKCYTNLLKDIHTVLPELTSPFQDFISEINTFRLYRYSTPCAYTHGDLHDFNLSYDGTFWDLDTFNYNPLTNDFAIFYWHFYAREDFLILKYNPWLSHYMVNELSSSELQRIQKLKKDFIKEYYSLLLSIFHKEDFLLLKKELSLKVFCRSFLVDNVLAFSNSDRYLIYQYWNNYLKNYNSSDFFNTVLFPKNSTQLSNFSD